MISRLRRKHQTTVRKLQAIQANWYLVGTCAFAVVLLAAISNSSAYQADSIPRSNGYAPPVHIPPRIPRFDPGLPESLNGRFNSTQQIRNTATTGATANISDVNEHANTKFGRLGPKQQSFEQRPSDHRRRPGFQDRVANMLAKNHSSATNKPGRQNFRQQTVRPRPQPDHTTIAAANPIPRQVRETMQATVDSFRTDRYPRETTINQPPKQQRVNQTAVAKRTIQKKKQPYYSRPDIRSTQVSAAARNTRSRNIGNVRTISAQQNPNESSRVVSSPQPNTQQPFVARQAVDSRMAQQLQLPRSNANRRDVQPISVLNNKPNEEMTLEAPGNMGFSSDIELSAPESLTPGESYDSFHQSNMLRSSAPVQDDELGSELSADDEEQFSEFGEELDDEDTKVTEKSCDDFRADLLNSPITDIALDISPPGKTELFGANVFRTWRDQYGNELAQGSISDLRRGYVIISSSNGSLVKLPYARLGDADWQAISQYWKLPRECGLGPGTYVERCWAPQTATWYASSLCHKPLYFENIQLERYGHSHGPFLQPVASTAHFFGRLFFLPYNTAIHPPNECQYALGFYRPGNCAPWLKDPFPFSFAGAARQSLFYSGVGFLAD